MPSRVSAGLHEVMVADRRAAERHQNVGLRLAGAARSPRSSAAKSSPAMPRSTTSAPALRAIGADRQIVGGDDLVGAGLGAGRDEFVAGRQDRDARAARDRQARMVHGGGEREFGRAEAAARRQHDVAFAKIEAGAAHG